MMYEFNKGKTIGKYKGKVITNDNLSDMPQHLIDSFLKYKIIKKMRAKPVKKQEKEIEENIIENIDLKTEIENG